MSRNKVQMNPDGSITRTDAQITKDEAAAAFFRIRRMLGWIGVALPILLVVSGMLADGRIAPTISDFFHSLQRDIFVGAMCAIGTFLICYDGYDKGPDEQISDNIITTIAGFSAILLALFPNECPDCEYESFTQFLTSMTFSPIVHYASASVFFLCMALICLVKFSKTRDPKKAKFYKICGWGIMATVMGNVILAVLRQKGSPSVAEFIVDNRLIFIVEAIGVWFFAAAWLRKGNRKLTLSELERRERG